jgi:triose-phosphate isomerase
MKHILLNLKRFDIPREYGGVNSISEVSSYGKYIIDFIKPKLESYSKDEVDFSIFFPEAHILNAVNALESNSAIKIGAQGVYFDDVSIGGGFGAFTTQRPASIVKALGAKTVLIGHCEERNTFYSILSEAGVDILRAREIVNNILNKEIHKAMQMGLEVVYCVGERQDEQEHWQEVIKTQLKVGLADTDLKKVIIAYEPIWSIGPEKVPADKDYITKIARFIKEVMGDIDVVYGGGLKADNAAMLASIPEISGGLIALTRFSGDIGFYPNEYLDIISLYLGR